MQSNNLAHDLMYQDADLIRIPEEHKQIKLNKNQVNFFTNLPHYETIIDCGTWRSGKSYESCLWIAMRMKKYPGIREFIGRKTLKSLRETTFRKFQEVLTNGYNKEKGKMDGLGLIENIDFRVIRNPAAPEIRFPNGASVVFGDLDINSIGKWLSAEYSDIFIDQLEEISKICFEKIASRQTQLIIEKLSGGTQQNRIVGAMNPPESATAHWTHKEFRATDTMMEGAIMLYSSLDENKDNLPEGYKKKLLHRLDKRTAEIYLQNLWLPISSHVVYEDFIAPLGKAGKYIEGGNLLEMEYNPTLESYISLDFGWTHPMSIGYWQHDPINDIFYKLYEVVASHVKTEAYCDLLMGKEIYHQSKYYKPPFSVWDGATVVPLVEATQSRQEADGASHLTKMRDIFRKRNIKLMMANEAPAPLKIRVANVGMTPGIMSCRSHIRTYEEDVMLYVDPRYCQRFISDVQSYHYPTDADGNITSEIPFKDGIVDNTMDEMRGLVGLISPYANMRLWGNNKNRGD